VDKQYLAQNFLGFFRRDYARVARAHLEAAGCRRYANGRVRERDSRRVRTVLRPAAEGNLIRTALVRLFQTSRRFNVQIQPQLIMLQKTLLNIEGLGRQLDPDSTCGPQPSVPRKLDARADRLKGLLRALRNEAPRWATMLPQLPRLVHRALAGIESDVSSTRSKSCLCYNGGAIG